MLSWKKERERERELESARTRKHAVMTEREKKQMNEARDMSSGKYIDTISNG